MSRNPLSRDDRQRFTGYLSLGQVEAAFWTKVDRRRPEECWPWLAGRTARGYGQFYAKAFPFARSAHRWAYYFANGHLPDNEISHICDNARCCNPAHLVDATRLENEQHKTEAGRRPAGVKNLPCPHCGGPQEGRSKRDNGRREFAFCIPCRREYMRTYRRQTVGAESPGE